MVPWWLGVREAKGFGVGEEGTTMAVWGGGSKKGFGYLST